VHSTRYTNKVYLHCQCPVSHLVDNGTVPYNDRRLLVNPEVGICNRRVVPRGRRQGRLADVLIQDPPVLH
jgi:hypothetical protein